MTDDATCSKKTLEGKVAIVTGGASGIGEATARHFIQHGARSVVIADVQDDKGRKVASSLNTTDRDRCIYIHCDVADEDQVISLVDSTVRQFGRLDVMFSNAGISCTSGQTVLDLDLSAYNRTFAVNARGMAACVKHAARVMVEGSVRGSIICTGSLAATVGTDVVTDYKMSKHAVLGLVRCGSLQLGSYGIRVNCVSPGAVEAPLFCGIVVIEMNDGMESGGCSSLKGVIKGRNVADAVVFLDSDEAEFVTGCNLVVDGGFRGR